MRSTHHGSIAVSRQRHTCTLERFPHRITASQFAALLGPHAARAPEHPRRTGEVAVLISADDGRIGCPAAQFLSPRQLTACEGGRTIQV
jgi:hypothetical protein